MLRTSMGINKAMFRDACGVAQIPRWLDCPHLALIAEQVPGLRFRMLALPSDIEDMSRVSHLSWKADGVEWMVSPEETRSWLEDRSDHDHKEDVLIAESGGQIIGFSELAWKPSEDDPVYYSHTVHLLPDWRGRGIMEAMFESNERRLREVTSDLPVKGRAYVRLWAYDGPNDWKSVIESSGYQPIWHLLEMARKSLDSVTEAPEPDGFDFGPVRPEEYPKIWALFRECFSSQPWESPDRWSKEVYEAWLRSPNFAPGLWKVARAGDEIVGVVENCVSEEECDAYGRKVARSVRVCVKDGWRRKGLATYLLTSSLKLLRNIGIDEVSLDTEVENESMAMRVYEGVGFETRRTFTFYAKPL